MTDAGELQEFPITECVVGNRNGIPICGGGYFRLFPIRATLSLLRRVNERMHLPFVFYTHPWEYDPQQPRLKAGTPLKRFRHYVNLARTEERLEKLLQSFSFDRLDKVLAESLGSHDSLAIAANGLAS